MSKKPEILLHDSEELFVAGGAWLEALYEQWLDSPSQVSAHWQAIFESGDAADIGAVKHGAMLSKMASTARLNGSTNGSIYTSSKTSRHTPCDSYPVEYPSRAIYLIHAWRVYGHTQANLDPLSLNIPQARPELELSYYGLSDADLDYEFPTGDMAGEEHLPLRDILARLRRAYAGSIGPELMHIANSAKKHWLFERLENMQGGQGQGAKTRQRTFEHVMHADAFEHFLHTRYMGQKRFSLEGGESLIPMLDRLIQKSGMTGVKEIILGMAHRGRLNVLANVLGKSLTDIFAEFEGAQLQDETPTGSGDVKYHLGFSSDIETPGGVVHLSLGFNPSHLEIITPVVLGSVRARQCRRKDKARRQVLGVLVHGDAAFAGQGVVAESLNLGELGGFRTGGTIHIVVNNQIGFTTNTYDSRSTLYCTDIAKMVQAPILHVNGDDPDACCLVMDLAMEYRNQFRSDVVIDLVCYRRHGHNEADSPEVTQPVMYREISKHSTVEQIYRQQLIDDGVMTADEAEERKQSYIACLDKFRKEGVTQPHGVNSLGGRWQGYVRNGASEPKTAVAGKVLEDLARRAHAVPDEFSLSPRVEKIYDARLQMMQGQTFADWGCGEVMAYATLLAEGGWIRLSGEDSGRGTFFHRHATVYDEKTGKSVVPLKQVENGHMSHFIVVDSMLSELAVMAFEYGYSVAEPRALVIWEAQYGDFANGAQVVMDQFIAAGESKWSRMSGLVLWLPHGYEGQGSEHSSARLERFLQLCAEDNMQVICPTTPAQVFHLLRRQSMIATRKPLVVMSPKSMLRLKASFSPLQDFTSGHFQPVIAESDTKIKAASCQRLLLCSGKVYYDLLAERESLVMKSIAIVRVERLYPFPAELLRETVHAYSAAKEVFWVQEEPANQGAWMQINSEIRRILLDTQKLYRISRPALAAPAVGSMARHKAELRDLLDKAFAKNVPTE
ncbi:MAG: 2-oxoglutarate dehydrogenase E1 component [Mariprofundaceae bacterium]|nr:2-oxoglutarate dehydrogenase E1 component [Mariprofundaceae bacterium]